MYKIPGKTVFLGKKIINLPACDSTNSLLISMAVKGKLEEGTILSTPNQTKGRGQGGNTWKSEPGLNLTFSILLHPNFLEPSRQFFLNMAVSLGIHDALKEIVNSRIFLKWPNDVLIGEKKVSGILVETGSQMGRPWAVLGIGINTNQTEFPGPLSVTATSLCMEKAVRYDIDLLFTALSRALERWYRRWQKEGTPSIIEAWKERSRMLGRTIHVTGQESSMECQAVDLNPDGSLLVQIGDGSTHSVHAADISVRYSGGGAPDA